MNNAPIGIFDSGFGGLSIWRAIRHQLPCESLIYLGDGLHCPYGSRSCEEVEQLSDRAVGDLLSRGCKLIVVACNTATAAAVEYLRAKYSGVDIVGVEPAVKPACEATKSGRVGVLATERSLQGGHLQRSVERYCHDIEIIPAFGRGFVELVEGGLESTPEAERVVRAVVEPMVKRGIDHIVLGCTHYPFLIPVLERVAPGVTIVDPAPAVARRVEQLLKRRGWLSMAEAVGGESAFDDRCQFITYADEGYRERLVQRAREIVAAERLDVK